MNRRIWVILLVAVGAIPIGLAVDEIWLHIHFRAIPLHSVSTTGPQQEMKQIAPGFIHGANGERLFQDPFGLALEKVCSRLRHDLDIFLVGGDDLTEAMNATCKRVLDGAAIDKVVAPKVGRASKNSWVVFFMGQTNSGPPKWVVQSIRLEGRSISVRYREPWFRESDLCDCRPYWCWAPLGELAPGTYTLALINTSKNETLKRTVVVGEP